MIDIMHAHQVFQKYLQNFDCENEKIKLKIIHTDGVIRCASEISRRMGLSETDGQLAELIALLHDIGRFEQARLFDSFEPSVMDHAAFGVQMLFGDQRMIREFIKEDTYDEVIKKAIARHSDFSVGEGLTPAQKLHACLIRDADKLDNCRVKLEESLEVLLGCTAEETGRQLISEAVWEECLANSAIHSEKRKTRMDYWVSYVAYFFDISFPETCELILERNYVEKVVNRIPYSNPETKQKMKQLQDMTEQFLEKKGKNKENNKTERALL